MVNVRNSWAESKGLNDEIVEYEAKELDEIRKIKIAFTEPFHVVCLQWLDLFFAKDYHFFGLLPHRRTLLCCPSE